MFYKKYNKIQCKLDGDSQDSRGTNNEVEEKTSFIYYILIGAGTLAIVKVPYNAYYQLVIFICDNEIVIKVHYICFILFKCNNVKYNKYKVMIQIFKLKL